ncbi:hypothetical protein E0X81_05990 [Halomonas sp. GDM18]|nr:hypothetical protein E0X81_05990 [Halomonas sp. GDM18]
MATVSKSLRYFRALGENQRPINIEDLIRSARNHRITVSSCERREVHEVLRIQHYRDTDDTPGLFLHVVRYVPGEHNETLMPGADSPEENETIHEAPEGMEYKDGDFFMFCSGENIIGCSHGMSIGHKKIASYLQWFINLDPQDDDLIILNISTALNLEKYRLIEAHGVSKISFKQSAYAASMGGVVNNSLLGRIVGSASRAFHSRVTNYDDEQQLELMEDLVIEGAIRLDGNTRASELTQAEIRRVAVDCAEDDDITIITQNNEKITSTDIKLQTIKSLKKNGKSLYYDEVWPKLREYFLKLRGERLLEQ